MSTFMEPKKQISYSKDFDLYLSEYQPDLKKIIGKHRYSHHMLDENEMLSEVNLSIVKKKEDIIDMLGENFCKTEFTKVAYNFAKNCIKWSYGRMSRQKYYAKRSDGMYQTEEGQKTSFELAVEQEGYEEEHYESFDKNAKYKYIIKLIRDYSYILTPSELKYFLLLERGFSHDEISEELGVTHQAVSACCIDMFAKIRAYLGTNTLEDNGFSDVSKGQESIKSFFTDESSKPMSEPEKNYLKKFLKDNYKVYDIHQLSKLFLNGKYSYRRLIAIINKLKLYGCVRKITNPKHVFSKSETREILKLFKKGNSPEEISHLLNIPVSSLLSKRGSFTKSGKLTRCIKTNPRRKHTFSTEERELALEMFRNLKTCEEVSKELSIPINSIRPLRGSFVKKNLLNITPEGARKKRAKMEST